MTRRLRVIINSIIILVIAAGISVTFLFYMQTILSTRTESNVGTNNQEAATFINNYVDENYKFVLSNLTNSSEETSQGKVNRFIRENENYYLAGYIIENNSCYYATKTSTKKDGKFIFDDLSKNQTLDQKVCIVKEKYLFNIVSEQSVIMYNFNINDTHYFVLQKFDELNNLVITPYNGHQAYYFIGSKDGIITDSNYPSESTITLSNVFNINSTLNDFISSFENDKVQTLDLKVEKRYYVTCAPILKDYNTNDLSVFSIVRTTWIRDISNIILYTSLVYIGIVVILVIGYTVFLNIQASRMKRKYGKEGSIIHDQNHYSVLIDKKGRVLSKNKKFSTLGIRSLSSLSNSVTILELEGRDDDFSYLLESRNEFTAKIKDAENNDKIIKFLVIRNNYGYQLLGSDSDTLEYKPLEEVVKTETNQEIKPNLNAEVPANIYEDLLKDEIYSTLNKKALYLDIDKIVSTKAVNNKKTYLFYFGISNDEEILRTFGTSIEELINTAILKNVKKCIGDKLIYNIDDHHFAFFYDLPDTFASLNKIIDSINNEMKKPTKVYGDEMETEVCFGIYHFASFTMDVKTTPKRIIDKLHLSFDHATKLTNKNFKLYDENLEITFKMDEIIAADIRYGLENNEFVTYYQPNYSLKEDRVSGFECLLRWNNEKYRNDSPFKYIQVAEKSGLINDIGFYTLVESFKLIKELNDPSLHISVNVSPAQFLQPGFIAKLVNLYSEYEVPYECICIEITETFLIQSMTDVVEKLKYLRSLGIKIYLDDFGTGYSSLLYLAELPVDVIKIDKAFITPLKTSKSSRTIVSELIQIATELNMDVVAEGVEDAYQVSFLEKKKCNNVQGWYFSKAVSKDEIQDALKIKRVSKGGK